MVALSSRNVRLTPTDRVAATIIYKALSQAKSEEELRVILATESAFEVDYADFIDEETFDHAHKQTPYVRALIAGWINGVRLIDNMPMGNRT